MIMAVWNQICERTYYVIVIILVIILYCPLTLADCEQYRIGGLPSHDDLLHNGWEFVGETQQSKIYKRKREGSTVYEVMARGIVEAPPHRVFDIITDYANYFEFMPYTTESRVRRKSGNTLWVYERLDFPFIDDRHFVVKVQLNRCIGEPDFYVVEWSQDNNDSLPKLDYAIVPNVNGGRWELWPQNDGKHTHASYYLHTDPGGWIPTFLVNLANRRALPEVITAVRERVAKK